MKTEFSPKLLAIVVVGVIAVVALGGWFAVVSPQRSKVTTLEQQVADAEAVLRTEQMLAKPKKKKIEKAQTDRLQKLTKAMPGSLEMASVLKQVQALAAETAISLDSFSPGAGTPLAGYNAVPIDIGVSGRYLGIQRFVRQLRLQAGSSGGRVRADGRLFDVQTLGLTPGAGGAPMLNGTIRITTFVYSGVLPEAVATDETLTTTDGTTATAAAGGTP